MAKKTKAALKKEKQDKAMFASMESAGTIYPKSPSGKRVAPKKKAKKK